MIQVINNEITQYSLPRTGTLSTGETVSGYNLLDEETLRNEGWLPLEDNPPSYDQETQYLVSDGYEILTDKVVKKYKVEDMPEPEPPQPSEIEVLQEENEKLKSKLQSLEQASSETSLAQEELLEILIEMEVI